MGRTGTQKLARSCLGRGTDSRNRGGLPLLVVKADADTDTDVDAVAAVVVVAVVVEVEAGETLAHTPTTSGRRGTRIMAPKPKSSSVAVANLASYDPNARSATPGRRTTALRSLQAERLLIRPLMRRP